jgi:hypothetical protein
LIASPATVAVTPLVLVLVLLVVLVVPVVLVPVFGLVLRVFVHWSQHLVRYHCANTREGSNLIAMTGGDLNGDGINDGKRARHVCP